MHHRYRQAALVASLLLAALTACTSNPSRTAVTTFVLVRHAEKASDGSKDPPLSLQGQARAQSLSKLLRDTPLAAVYATAYRRTQDTASAVATSQGLAVTTYDANRPTAEFADALRHGHDGKNILIVGHSNTVPELATALCRCSVEPIADDEFDRLVRVRVAPDGTATLVQDRY